ncbi:MAG TPA: DUF885 domain-containing protein [Steroidobacteraceae bacterium]
MPISLRQGFLALMLAASALAQANDAAWVEQSNANAAPLLDVMARYAPESAAALGVDGHDEAVFDLKPGYDTRFEADLAALSGELEAKLATTTEPRVRQDLQILVTAARDQATTSRLNRQLMLPYFDLGQVLFRSFDSLLDPRVAKERYPAALTRLRRYTGTEPGYTPIAELARARIEERFATPGLTGPWTVEVEQSLENQPRYLDGIKEAFEKSGLEAWQDEHAKLVSQLDEHAKWVKSTVLPRARRTNRLPPEIYADNLRNFGVKADPQELIQTALIGYMQARDELDALARQVARERKYPDADYRAVLAQLKKDTIANDDLMPTYRARLGNIEEIVRRERIVTMPDRAAVIRLASEGESTAQPAPHLSPPRLIGNTGEPAEFVLPLENPNAPPGTKMDDFTFDAITWTLTAHEARPGHELQFAKMVENGTSIPRVIFAFNSANVEGWALYAEAVMKQYLPVEGQIGSLQMRLMRAARAFLDPMINLGTMEPVAAQQFLMKEVGLSEPMAKQEIDRYSFRAPGQATSYFYGYQKQLELRARAEMALGARFDELSYHDFVIGEGLLPPELLEQAVMERYVAPRRTAAAAGAE